MDKDKQIGHRMKGQLKKYLNRLFPEWGAVEQKTAFDLTFGIAKSGDIKVSSIGRALGEKQKLKHTLKRLYNGLSSREYSQVIEDAVASRYAGGFTEDTVLAIDLTDISKPYAKKMANMSYVHDGDTGKLRLGYQQIVITANRMGEDRPQVLGDSVFSKAATPEITSRDVCLAMLADMRPVHGSGGIRVADRFFDNKHYFRFFAEAEEKFVIRAKGNRKVLEVKGGRVVPGKVGIEVLADSCRTPSPYRVSSWKNGEWHRKTTVRAGSRKVFLPCINQIITMVVLKGFGRTPMVLLTNIEVPREGEAVLERIIQAYRSRWMCEEWVRFAKQEYQLEDIRSLNYQSLINVLAFALLAMDFITKHLGRMPALRTMQLRILKKAIAIFEQDAKFLFYRLSAGTRDALKMIAAGYKKLKQELAADPQLELAL